MSLMKPRTRRKVLKRMTYTRSEDCLIIHHNMGVLIDLGLKCNVCLAAPICVRESKHNRVRFSKQRFKCDDYLDLISEVNGYQEVL